MVFPVFGIRYSFLSFFKLLICYFDIPTKFWSFHFFFYVKNDEYTSFSKYVFRKSVEKKTEEESFLLVE